MAAIRDKEVKEADIRNTSRRLTYIHPSLRCTAASWPRYLSGLVISSLGICTCTTGLARCPQCRIEIPCSTVYLLLRHTAIRVAGLAYEEAHQPSRHRICRVPFGSSRAVTRASRALVSALDKVSKKHVRHLCRSN